MISSSDLSTDLNHHVVRFPTRYAPYLPTTLSAKSPVRPAGGRQVQVRRHLIRQVVILEVAGRLSDVVDDLNRGIQTALAEGPRAVVCDLTAVQGSVRQRGAGPSALVALAAAGRHVRDWPGVPIAVACPDPQIQEGLRADPLGKHLIVVASLFSALTSVLATPVLSVGWTRLAAHPTAPCASARFVTQTLQDWGLDSVISRASLVVKDLVTSSSINAGTDIDVSICWNLGALRLAVRDHGPALPHQRPGALDLPGRGLSVVVGLSRAFGVLPTTDGGSVVWAVLDASKSRPSTISGTLDLNPVSVKMLHSVPPMSGGKP